MLAPVYSAPLLAGDAGTEQTIDLIRRLVDQGKKDSYVNRTAIDIIRNAGADEYDHSQQAFAIYNWVRSTFYFVNDPVGKEALRSASDLLELRAGDCDDINAVLIPSLLETIGIETRLVTIAADRRDPSLFSHIYAEACINGEWVAMDAARPGAEYGSAPPSFFRRECWSLNSDHHGPYECEAMNINLGAYGQDSRTDSVLRPLIGPGGVTIQSKPQSGLSTANARNLGWLVVGVVALLLIGGKLK